MSLRDPPKTRGPDEHSDRRIRLAPMASGVSAETLERTLPDSLDKVAPALSAYATEALLGDVWTGTELALRERALVTVAALIAAGQPEQMTFHLNHAMDNELSRHGSRAMLAHLAFHAGWPKEFSALPVARAVFESRAD